MFQQLFDPANAVVTVPDPTGNPYIGDATQDGLSWSYVNLALTIDSFKISAGGKIYTVPALNVTLIGEKYYQLLYDLSTRTWTCDPKDTEGDLLYDPDKVCVAIIYTYNNGTYYFSRKILSSLSVRQEKRRNFSYSVLDWVREFGISDAPYNRLIKDANGGGFTAYFMLIALYLIAKIPAARQTVKNAILDCIDFCAVTWWKSQGVYVAGQHIIAQGKVWRVKTAGTASINPVFTGSYANGDEVTDNTVVWVAMADAPNAPATKRNYAYRRGTAAYQDGFLWICTTAGTTAGSAPSYAAHLLNDTVTDGTAVFTASRADVLLQSITGEARSQYLTDFNGLVNAYRSFDYKVGDHSYQNGFVWRCTTAGHTAVSSPFSGSYSHGNTVTDGTAVWTAEIVLSIPWAWRREDSTDSYPAVLALALGEYIARSGDTAILELNTRITKASSGFQKVKEILGDLIYDGCLTNIQPDTSMTSTYKYAVTPEGDVYQIEFTGDNCEVFNGQISMAEIYRVLADSGSQATALSFADGFKNAIGAMFDVTDKKFLVYSTQTRDDLNMLRNYADCFAQRMPSEHSVSLPYSEKRDALKQQNVGNWHLHQHNIASELATVALLAKNGHVAQNVIDESIDAWIDIYALESGTVDGGFYVDKKGSALDYAAYLALTQN